MAFIKRLEEAYGEPLSRAVSWKVEFRERTTYNVVGDATRAYSCELQMITYTNLRGNTELLDMISSIEGLSSGWLNFKVSWTVIKERPLFPKDSVIPIACSICGEKLFQNKPYYACLECAPLVMLCHTCANHNLEYYLEYHN
jgi:hypothetical protein